MPPDLLRAYIERRPMIEAQEQIARAIVAVFAYPPSSQEEVDHRLSLMEEWENIAAGRDQFANMPDFYQRGGTIYVKTAEAMRRAFRMAFRVEKERELFAVDTATLEVEAEITADDARGLE